jgi:hypothetical protein
MTARDHLLIRNDTEWNATVDEILAEHRAEVLNEAADKLALELSADGPTLPGYPLAVRSAVRHLRSMADGTEAGAA